MHIELGFALYHDRRVCACIAQCTCVSHTVSRFCSAVRVIHLPPKVKNSCLSPIQLEQPPIFVWPRHQQRCLPSPQRAHITAAGRG
jgi:hypothetical protein